MKVSTRLIVVVGRLSNGDDEVLSVDEVSLIHRPNKIDESVMVTQKYVNCQQFELIIIIIIKIIINEHFISPKKYKQTQTR